MEETRNNSFVFYKSWANFIDEFDEEEQKEIVYQIYLYGMGRELTTNNKYIKAYLKDVKESIDEAKGRYIRSVVNGGKGGRKKINLDIEQILNFIEDGYTYEQIGKAMGVHANTIGNRVRDYKKQKQEQEQTQEYNKNTTNKNKNQNNNSPEEEVKDNEEVKDFEEGKVEGVVLENNNTPTSHFNF